MTRLEKRRRLSGWLRSFWGAPRPRAAQHPGLGIRQIRIEPLETRQLLAADGFAALLEPVALEGLQSSGAFGVSGLTGEGELSAEGEDTNDLVAFAKALAASETKFYGAAWCPFCTQQKELFEDGYKYLPFIEVSNPDRTPNDIAEDENITNYPTWEFPDGTRLEGLQSLATISQRSGIAIPQSSTPSFDQLPNVQVGIGSPLHVPIDAYDPNGNPLTITVTSSNPDLIGATVLSGNRSLRLSTQGFGDMVFELFEDRAPVPSGRVIELAEDGFYDGVTFHRVINNFVIQGGDPTGTGSGGSTLGDFDDQFHLDLQHNRTGVLSYAKSSDDTNDSQFFITEGPQRGLDFNHSIFGQLVEGDQVRDAISGTATNASDRPLTSVVINSATVFSDLENGMIMLKPTGNGTGTATITVTVADNEGNSTSQSFVATVVQDTANGAPFLNPIPQVSTSTNVPVTVNLTSQDAEGDAVVYSVQQTGSTSFSVIVNSATGVATVTPPTGFSGELQFIATVRQNVASTTNSTTDTQLVSVLVTQNAPTGLDLLAASDSGSSQTDNLTNATSLTFAVSGTTLGALVELRSGGTVVGSATATGATTEVTVAAVTSLGQGSVLFTARQTISGQVSGDSPSLAVTLDRDAPTTIASGVFPSSAIVNQTLNLDLDSPEEGQGLVYALATAPAGMTITSDDGQIEWTPVLAQLGPQGLLLRLTDAAGNETTQQISINVIEEPLVQIILSAVSLAGTPLSSVAAGETFKVQLTVQDLRPGTSRTGVFAAYLDLLFDSNIIEPIAISPIRLVDPYDNDPSGTVAVGLIDELGAFSNRTSTLGPDARLFAEVTFRALATGEANLRTEAADLAGNDILLYDLPAAIAASRINFGTSNFAVGANFELANDIFNFDEDTGQQSLDVLANDTVTSGAVLTISDVGATSNGGTVSIASDGRSLLYTSAANFNGAEVFTYTARNQGGISRTATVTVQVTDVNDPPVALNDTFSVTQNSTNNVLEVLGNDNSGVDADANENLRVQSVTSGSAGGTIVVAASGLTVRYTPASGFTGTETFTYALSDGRGGTANANVSVSVALENPPPTPQDDSFTVIEDAAQASFDVLANDTSDDPTETLSIFAVGTSTVGSQVLVSSNNLSVLYRPAPNFNGQEVITYTLLDSNGGTATGRMTFSVTAVNDAPVAVNDNLNALSSQPTTNLDVLANDTNVDQGETLTITAVTQPAAGNGSVAIATNGRSLIYTPPSATFEGSVTFNYTIDDGNGLTASATVNLTVSDFVPRAIRGQLITSGFAGSLTGLELRLSGTDLNGSLVTQTRLVANDGSYTFGDLAPGSYTVSREALPYLLDSGEQFTVVSGIDDGDVVHNFVVAGGLHPRYFDIRDFLGSTFQNILTAVIDSDGDEIWVAPTGSWDELSAHDLEATTTSVTVNAVNALQQSLTTTLPVAGVRVSEFTDQSSMMLVKVRGSTTASGLAPVRRAAAASQLASASGGLVAEGEGSAAPAVESSAAYQGMATNRPLSNTVGQALSAYEDSKTRFSQIAVSDASMQSLATGRSNSPLTGEAVDSVMQEVMPKLQLQLTSDLETQLTMGNEAEVASRDVVFSQL